MESEILKFLLIYTMTYKALIAGEVFGPIEPGFFDRMIDTLRARISHQLRELMSQGLRHNPEASAYILGSPNIDESFLMLEQCAAAVKKIGMRGDFVAEGVDAAAFLLASSDTMAAISAGIIRRHRPELPLHECLLDPDDPHKVYDQYNPRLLYRGVVRNAKESERMAIFIRMAGDDTSELEEQWGTVQCLLAQWQMESASIAA